VSLNDFDKFKVMLAKIKVCGAPVLVDFALTLPVWICVLVT
jgi:hypothetical protein